MSQIVFLEQAAPACQPIAGAADHEWKTTGCSRLQGRIDAIIRARYNGWIGQTDGSIAH